MSELEHILKLACEADWSEPLALATLVHRQGAAYAPPGACRLIAVSGRASGMLGGGDAERELHAQALEVMASGQARLVAYDSSSSPEIIYGFGLESGGLVRILIEPLLHAPVELLGFYAACRELQSPGRIVTVFESRGLPTALRVGGRLLLWPDGRITSDFRDPRAVAALTRALFDLLDQPAVVKTVDLPGGGSVTALFDAVLPPSPLVVFGGGEDAAQLVYFAKRLGRHVTVVHASPDDPSADRFPLADSILCIQPETLKEPGQLELNPGAQAIIMTHQFRQDREWLRLVLPQDLQYVGVLGSKADLQRMLDQLAQDGVCFSEEAFARLHAPVGLGLDAATPAEFALSILAGLQAALAGGAEPFLYQRPGPLDDSAEQILLAAW